ncbi:MAG: PorP/SprF family type IX secretion system membrane protein [Bacteroidetes bacterium]|nr:PorP/SprF family type IX secretion system membrane protein [Bacteroidota bacterium]
MRKCADARLWLLTFSFSHLLTCAFAQDVHFSQFNLSPLTLNPALASVGCDMRGTLNYKDQWKSVTTPFRTAAFSYEMAFMKRKWKKGYIGAGISDFNDKAGDSKMGTNQLNLSLSSVIKLNQKNFFSAGLEAGFAQRHVSTEGLHWDNQFIGTAFDPSLPSGENFSSTNISYGDFAAGLLWTYGKGEMYSTANDEVKANMGISAFHVSAPNISFYGNDIRLSPRIVFHGGMSYGIKNSNTSIVPSYMFAKQGAQQEFILGSMARFRLKEDSKYTGFVKGSAVSFGGYYRMQDAVIISSLIEVAQYAIGISYDVNTSPLTAASSGKGGLELSLRFISPGPFSHSVLSGPTPSFGK